MHCPEAHSFFPRDTGERFCIRAEDTPPLVQAVVSLREALVWEEPLLTAVS